MDNIDIRTSKETIETFRTVVVLLNNNFDRADSVGSVIDLLDRAVNRIEKRLDHENEYFIDRKM